MLDAKIASALNMIIHNSHFKKKVSLEEQKVQKEDRFQRGRQIAFIICDYFRVTGADDTVQDYADSFSVTLPDVNIQEFDTKWDEVLLSMYILGSLYKLRIRESVQLQTVFKIVRHGNSPEDIDAKLSKKMKTMVKRRVDQKLRDYENLTPDTGELNETGAVVKNRKGLSGVERGKGTCHQLKE